MDTEGRPHIKTSIFKILKVKRGGQKEETSVYIIYTNELMGGWRRCTSGKGFAMTAWEPKVDHQHPCFKKKKEYGGMHLSSQSGA